MPRPCEVDGVSPRVADNLPSDARSSPKAAAARPIRLLTTRPLTVVLGLTPRRILITLALVHVRRFHHAHTDSTPPAKQSQNKEQRVGCGETSIYRGELGALLVRFCLMPIPCQKRYDFSSRVR